MSFALKTLQFKFFERRFKLMLPPFFSTISSIVTIKTTGILISKSCNVRYKLRLKLTPLITLKTTSGFSLKI